HHEGGAGVARHEDVSGAALELAIGLKLVVPLHLIGKGVHRLQKGSAAYIGLEIEVGGGGDIGDLEVALIRIAGAEGFVASAKPGAFAQLPGERRIARYRYVRRQRPAEAELLRHHRADGGKIAE